MNPTGLCQVAGVRPTDQNQPKSDINSVGGIMVCC